MKNMSTVSREDREDRNVKKSEMKVNGPGAI